MNIHLLEQSLARKYRGEPVDEVTLKHITEDVKSVYPGVDKVSVSHEFGFNSISLSLTFKTPADETWFLLQWA